MVRKATVKDILREMIKTRSRFLSIAVLIFLSAAFFTGLRGTRPSMHCTLDAYADGHAMYDILVRSTLGLTQEDIDTLGEIEGVSAAAGAQVVHALIAPLHEDAAETVVSLETMGQGGLNTPKVLEGRLPEKADECAVEELFLAGTGLQIGDRFEVRHLPEGMEDALTASEFTITGLVRSPLYVSKAQRGPSTLGSGSVTAYAVITPEAVALEYYPAAYVTVAGAVEEIAYSAGYEKAVAPVLQAIEDMAPGRAALRREEIVSDAQQELDEARQTLEEKRAELQDAEEQLADARQKLEDGRRELEEGKETLRRELNDAERKLQDAERELSDAAEEIDRGWSELFEQKEKARTEFEKAEGQIVKGRAQLEKGYEEYSAARAELEAQLEEWYALPEFIRNSLPEQKAAIEAAEAELDAVKARLDAENEALIAGEAELNDKRAQAEREFADAENRLADAQREYEEGLKKHKEGREEFKEQKRKGEAEIAKAEQKLLDGEAEIAENEEKVYDGIAKLTEAEQELEDAEEKIADIPKGEWFVDDRDANTGYKNFAEDADRIGAIANVFPLIFFLVAALVSLTTMTRMVEEKRTEIGTYKALGYPGATTAAKFVAYSFVATVVGYIPGVIFGSLFLPWFVLRAYSILYELPRTVTYIHIPAAAFAAVAALICTVGATVMACTSTLRETPASLLRPRAPLPGRRVLLERVTPLWRRLSFFSKVTIRNIFRFKKRLFMTLVGIAGCTALIVAALGLRDSITDITNKQFGEIYTYQLRAYLDGEHDAAALAQALDKLEFAEYLFIDTVSVNVSLNGGKEAAEVLIPQDTQSLPRFITLRDRCDHTPVELSEEGAVVTEKLTELLDLQAGDTVELWTDTVYNANVRGITEQYAGHYLYMSRAYYESVFGEAFEPTQILICIDEAAGQMPAHAAAELLKIDGIAYVSSFIELAGYFSDSMKSVDSVVVILLISAGLLALVVLYNLTNINITERMRELATIKVLGFFDREVSVYVFRENAVLTLMGMALGLVGGYFLHAWLIGTVELSFIMFGRDVRPPSYVFAALLTLVFTVAVNVFGHRRMMKINMVESLKINE
jgi:putative ABC transport system permease protein